MIESPTLFSTPVVLNSSAISVVSGDGAFFDVTIPNVHPTSSANQELLAHAIMASGTYNQGFGTVAPSKPLAAYQIFTGSGGERIFQGAEADRDLQRTFSERQAGN